METKIYHRTLSLQETQAVKCFHLGGMFKTGKEKVYHTHILCRNCSDQVDQIVLMSEYSDGSWLKERDIDYTDPLFKTDYVIENITTTRVICQNCLNKEDKAAVIEYYRHYIKTEYWNIINRGFKHKEPSESFEPIITAACRAALFEGNYENWMSFLPKRVVEELEKRK